MTHRRRTLHVRYLLIAGAVVVLAGLAALAAWLLRPATSRPPVVWRAARILAERGGTPRFAVPDPAPVSGDLALAEAARVAFAGTLRDDLRFEREFEVLPTELLALIPGAPAENAAGRPPAACSEWRELGADGLLLSGVRQDGDRAVVEVRLFRTRTGELVFQSERSGAVAELRRIAHALADEILAAQTGIRGVAGTRLAFVSDRNGSHRSPTGEPRRVKEIYVADYDGANQSGVTWDGDLDLTPSWAPDRRAIAYTSYRRGFQDIFIASLEDRLVHGPTRGAGKNWLPAWSPDGRRIAFTSSRGGASSIFVMNADGSDVRRLTSGWAIDTSPAWSPSGKEIAFTSNRSGRPQIWVMNADGTAARQLTFEKYCDRPTWSPPPFNEIAYVSQTPGGFDIKVLELATGRQRQLTAGGGYNESPSWAPNGRHLAFSSTRAGAAQIWTMTRRGSDLRQVTRVGTNTMPDWSR